MVTVIQQYISYTNIHHFIYKHPPFHSLPCRFILFDFYSFCLFHFLYFFSCCFVFNCIHLANPFKMLDNLYYLIPFISICHNAVLTRRCSSYYSYATLPKSIHHIISIPNTIRLHITIRCVSVYVYVCMCARVCLSLCVYELYINVCIENLNSTKRNRTIFINQHV